MSNDSSGSAGALTVDGLLGTVFVVMKLMHIIDWSWWWVTSPFWGGLALVLVVIAVLFGWYLVETFLLGRAAHRRAKGETKP